MTMKETLTLEIQTIAFGGHGVARTGGLVVFVPFTAPGDIAKIEITARKKKYARGRLLEIVEPSRHRTQPVCRYYGQCGGCAYQHIDYESQLKIKQAQVRETFARIGGVSTVEVREVIGSPAAYAYRGKARLHAVCTGGEAKLGFMDVSGGEVTDIGRCEIVDESINEQIGLAKSIDGGSGLPDDLIFWSQPSGRSDDLISRFVHGKEFSVPRDGFFQANLYLTDRLVDEAGIVLRQKERGTVMDACCGAGLFSVLLASACRRMIGVEINEKSIACARANAERHEISNADFICGDLGNVVKSHDHRKDPIDLIIVDPPRTGLSATSLEALGGAGIPDIVYISCNPATQARDVRLLGEKGYVLASLQPLDMFPQTQHIEVIALLRK